MKFLVWIFLLGTCLNVAVASGPETINISGQESTAPKFSNLVKSTMDLLGPEEALADAPNSDELLNQSLAQSLSVFAKLSSEQTLDQSCE